MTFPVFGGWVKTTPSSNNTVQTASPPVGVVNGDTVIMAWFCNATQTPSVSADWTLLLGNSTAPEFFIWTAVHSSTLSYAVTTGGARTPTIITGKSSSLGSLTFSDPTLSNIDGAGTTVGIVGGGSVVGSDTTYISFAAINTGIADPLTTGPSSWTYAIGDTTAGGNTGACQAWGWTQNINSGSSGVNGTATYTNSNRKVSRTIAVVITSASVPSAPTGVSALGGNLSATVSYTQGANNGSAVTGNVATSSPGGFTGTASAPGNPITVSGLSNGTAYTFTVTATNGVGTSVPSVASNSVTPAPGLDKFDPMIRSTAVMQSAVR